MKLESIKDLDKLMILCRKRGIKTFKLDNIEFVLADVEYTEARPKSKTSVELQPLTNTDSLNIQTDSLTEEQMLMWSAQGHEEPVS